MGSWPSHRIEYKQLDVYEAWESGFCLMGTTKTERGPRGPSCHIRASKRLYYNTLVVERTSWSVPSGIRLVNTECLARQVKMRGCKRAAATPLLPQQTARHRRSAQHPSAMVHSLAATAASSKQRRQAWWRRGERSTSGACKAAADEVSRSIQLRPRWQASAHSFILF